MKKKVNVRVDLSKMKDIQKFFKSNFYTKVGILRGKTNRKEKGLTNASLGVIHEFGSVTRKIPPRSFLRMPLEMKQEYIIAEILKRKRKITKEIYQGNAKSFSEKLGILSEQVIQMAFESRGFGQWRENKPSTVRRKKSSSPLIDTGQLRRSITSKVEKYG